MKEDVKHMYTIVSRFEALEAEVNKMRGFIVASETREAKMVNYLEKLDADRPTEGQTIMGSFKVIYNDLEETKGHFAGHVVSMEDMKLFMNVHIAETAAKFEQLVSMQASAAQS